MNLTLFVFGFVFVLQFGYNFATPGGARIVGGTNATKPYPYQVSLQTLLVYQTPNGKIKQFSHVCGGSIITKRHILTAGHCVFQYGRTKDVNSQFVLAGTSDLNEGGKRYRTSKLVQHPNYADKHGKLNNNYDLGVVTLKDALKFIPEKLQPINLSKKETKAGVICIATGWGSAKGLHSYEPGARSPQLQEMHAKTVSFDDCTKAHHGLTEGRMCVLAEKGEGLCDGDSGGPLVDIQKGVQICIAQSVGNGDHEGCGTGVPDVCTSVSTHYDWIMEQIK